MKILKTMLNPLRQICMLLLLFSFSNHRAQNQNSQKPLEQFVETTFEVKDFDVWKPLFLKDSLVRKQNGIKTFVISSKIGQPRQMMNVSAFGDLKKTKASMKNPAFLQRIKERGVTNAKSEYYKIYRFDPTPAEKKWVIMTHKVKNFDVWVAAFDKGKSLRTNAGLIDVLIATNMDDPTMVQVVCDVTDVAKAEAFYTSKVLKEKMKAAGVIGQPKIEMYESRN